MPPCLIMSGGRGTRLGFITKHKPKPAINIHGKPFVYFLLDWLKSNEIRELIFFTSYKKKFLERIVDNYKNRKHFKIQFINDKKRKGTFNAIYENIKKLKGNYIYTNADEINLTNIKRNYSKFVKKKHKISMFFYKNNKGKLHTGLKIFKSEIFVKTNKKFDKFEDYLDFCIKKKKIKLHQIYVKELPIRIDTPNYIRIANKKFSEKK